MKDRLENSESKHKKLENELKKLWKQSNAILEGTNKMGKDVEKLDEKYKEGYYDLGMIFTNNGELYEYQPSQFISELARENRNECFSLFGYWNKESSSEQLLPKEKELNIPPDHILKKMYKPWMSKEQLERLKEIEKKEKEPTEEPSCLICRKKNLQDYYCPDCVDNIAIQYRKTYLSQRGLLSVKRADLEIAKEWIISGNYKRGLQIINKCLEEQEAKLNES